MGLGANFHNVETEVHGELINNQSRKFKTALLAPSRSAGERGQRFALDAFGWNLPPVSRRRHGFRQNLVCSTGRVLAPALGKRPTDNVAVLFLSPGAWMARGGTAAAGLDVRTESELHFYGAKPRLPARGELLELAALVRGWSHLTGRDDTLDAYAWAALHDSRPLLQSAAPGPNANRAFERGAGDAAHCIGSTPNRKHLNFGFRTGCGTALLRDLHLPG